jgi:hypothetical protein
MAGVKEDVYAEFPLYFCSFSFAEQRNGSGFIVVCSGGNACPGR